MQILLLESEIIAERVAWQLRSYHLKRFVIISRPDLKAIQLAISLAGGKTVKSWRLFDFVVIVAILSIVLLNIVGPFNHFQPLSQENLELELFLSSESLYPRKILLKNYLE